MMTILFFLLKIVNFIYYCAWFASFGIAVWGAKKTAKKGYVFIATAIALMAIGGCMTHYYKAYAQRGTTKKFAEMAFAPENREAQLRAHQEIQRAVIQAYEKENIGEIADFYITPAAYSTQTILLDPALVWSLFAAGLYLLVRSEPQRK